MRRIACPLCMLALVGSLFLASCGMGGSAPSRAGRTQTAVARAIGLPLTLSAGGTAVAQLTEMVSPSPALPTATLAVATDTVTPYPLPATPIPTTALPPTLVATVSLPTAYPTPSPKPVPVIRIAFQTGATAGSVEAVLETGSRRTFLVRALARQVMLARVSSSGGDVYFSLSGASDGRVLLPSASRSSYWKGTLPRTQDYRIIVYAGERDSHFQLDIIIPKRITFKPGATSTQIQGSLDPDTTITYLARARAGQTMTVTVGSPANDVYLAIYGLEDGETLARDTDAQTSWSGSLPETQDYAIALTATGERTRYSLEVAIR